LPSSAFAPGQVGDGAQMNVMAAIAYGDLASAVLALIAAWFLHYRLAGAIGVAWIVNIATSVDWIYATYLPVTHGLANDPLGGNWYIINYYVPLIGVIHVAIFARLLRARPTQADHLFTRERRA